MTGLLLDIIVVAVAVLLLIFGLWRGMYKMIFGLVTSLLSLVLTIVLLSTVTGFVVEKTTLDERLMSAIDQPLSGALSNANAVIVYYDSDNDGTTDALGYADGGDMKPFSELLAGSPYALFSPVLQKVVAGRIDAAEGQEVTFLNALSSTLVGYIIMAIMFVVLLIIFAILVRILMMLVKKLVTHTYIGHFINKFLGAVLGLAIGMLIIWGSLAVIKLLGTYEWIIPVNELIESSTLTKLLFNNNFIYKFLVNSFDIKGVIDGILAGLSSSGS